MLLMLLFMAHGRGGVAAAGYYSGLVAAGAAFFVIPMIWLTIFGNN
ncbi:MAG: hypothetical protein LBQ34_04510 [Alphaproteobacteria bacterium]|jgi:hypothetical protein|nr:hypothetical protein [Alphaproteobacteria bacterium]